MLAPNRSTHPSALALLLTATALLLSACGGGDDSSSKDGTSKQAAPKCGATTDGDLQIVRTCGKATGEIQIDGEVVAEFSRGECTGTDDSVVLNLGDTVVDPSPSQRDLEGYDSLSILAGKYPAAARTAAPVDKDGTYSAGVLMASVIDGRTLALQKTTLVLSGDRNNGTFFGTSTENEKVTGSFSCGA